MLARPSALGTTPGRTYPDRVELLERDHEIAVLREALAGAAAGQGCAVAVTGDAGVGKSTLLDALSPGPLRRLRGSCDPLRTPRPLGPFRDIAAAAGLDPLLRGDDLLLSQVCEQIYDALRCEATVLVVEDLHWVDAASVDVLRFLARRLGSMPLALLVSYRDHEIGPRHSLRPLLGDFARLDGLHTLELPPLSVAAVERLVDGTRLNPRQVHALTGGNPFFVTEVVKDAERPLPASVRDAVLARVADLAAEDLEVLQLVAAAPDRLDDRLLPLLGVELATLHRLDATGLLTRPAGGLVFRHELARQAVESTIPPGGSSRLHARLLDSLERLEPREPAVLTHHAVAARDAGRAVTYAQAAAEEAIRAGSHTEAAAFFQTALDHLDNPAAHVRAALLQRLSFEQYMTSHLAEAIATVRSTFPLWRLAGDADGLSKAHETCAVYEYYNARRREAEAHADRAATIALEGGSDRALGAARATRGFLAYMRQELEPAEHWGADARRIAEGLGAEHRHETLALRSELIGILAGLAGERPGARERLRVHIDTTRGLGLDELASTGYSHLVAFDVEHRRFRAAERALEESLPFATQRDIPICRHWQAAIRARLRFAQGRWNAAVEDADQVLDEQGMPLALVWPRVVAALVQLRRGEVTAGDRVDEHLDAAWQLAEQIDEPLRRLPVLAALAETMWLTGVADEQVTGRAVHEVSRLAGTAGSGWAVGDLAAWLDRLGLAPDVAEDDVAEPFRLARRGEFEHAAARWHQAGEVFTEAMTLSDSPDPAHRARGVTLLDGLGALATADRLRIDLRRDGVAQVPQRPRASTRANPAGLTNRQLDVAKLVVQGLTNAEIAARLYIAPKTADHHVSALLTKLGLPNRRAVVVRADDLGLV